MDGYIFGGEGLPKSPKELERMRKLARSMAPSRTPRNIGEGLDALGKAFLVRSMTNKADKAEKAGATGASDSFNAVLKSMLGGGGGGGVPKPQITAPTPASNAVPTPQGISFTGAPQGGQRPQAVATPPAPQGGQPSPVAPQAAPSAPPPAAAQASPQPNHMATLAAAMSNPHMNEGQRSVLEALMKQKMTAQDPMRKLQMQKLGNEINPEYMTALDRQRLSLDQSRFKHSSSLDLSKHGLDRERFQHEQNKPMTVGGTSRLATPDGEVLLDAVPDRSAPTVQKLKQADGSELAVQWNAEAQSFDPINAPAGGANVMPKNKLTENQAKLTLFRSLQTETNPVLLDLEKQFDPANFPDHFAGNVLGGNFFRSELGQMYASASSAWAEGALRIATGAAATPEEMERTKHAYFAQPGDTKATIQFKAKMREMYDRSIQRSLGNRNVEGSLPLPSEFMRQFSGDGSQQAPAGEQAAPSADGWSVRRID